MRRSRLGVGHSVREGASLLTPDWLLRGQTREIVDLSRRRHPPDHEHTSVADKHLTPNPHSTHLMGLLGHAVPKIRPGLPKCEDYFDFVRYQASVLSLGFVLIAADVRLGRIRVI
jgi:hypothetical protein